MSKKRPHESPFLLNNSVKINQFYSNYLLLYDILKELDTRKI